MTKERPPLTVELALTKIAVAIGWDQVAAIAGQCERTVRNWSDPDTTPKAADAISLELALKLDVAFRVAGGDGAPMLQCYATRLDTETADAVADKVALARQAAKAAKEGGEAIAAVIAAAMPGASEQELARAEIELEESIAAQTNIVATLRAGRKGRGAMGADREGTTGARPGEGNQ